jgi:hypothetical protein
MRRGLRPYRAQARRVASVTTRAFFGAKAATGGMYDITVKVRCRSWFLCSKRDLPRHHVLCAWFVPRF